MVGRIPPSISLIRELVEAEETIRDMYVSTEDHETAVEDARAMMREEVEAERADWIDPSQATIDELTALVDRRHRELLRQAREEGDRRQHGEIQFLRAALAAATTATAKPKTVRKRTPSKFQQIHSKKEI